MRARSLWAPALVTAAPLLIAATIAGCGLSLDYDPQDPGPLDASGLDAGSIDAGSTDGDVPDGSLVDGGNTPECREDVECQDGTFCNGEEHCVAGICEPGTSPCPDPSACLLAVCDEDGRACAGAESTCAAPQICSPEGVCVDPRECTNDTACDDGNPCNGLEVCLAGVCAVTAPGACADDDGIACTLPICSSDLGGCSEIPMDSLCPDANPGDCLVPHCTSTGCTPMAVDTLCADTFACTTDACRPGSTGADAQGCVHALDDSSCSDGVACTFDACRPGALLHDALGCVHRPNDMLCATSGSALACGALLCVGADALAADPASMGCAMTLDSARCGLTSHCIATAGGPICSSFDDGCASDADCDDSNECNGREQCVGGRCARTTAGCPTPGMCLQSWCDVSTSTCRTRRDPACGGFGL